MRVALDSSALVAVALGEPDADLFHTALFEVHEPIMSAINVFETKIVLHHRSGPNLVRKFEDMLAWFDVDIIAFDDVQAGLAYTAHRRFGKGSGSGAKLNIGDCAAYAAAMSHDMPLLFKGRDFLRTDIVSALPLLVPGAGSGP